MAEGNGGKTLFVAPGSPWENGCIKSFNKKLRDELRNGEIADTLLEAWVLVESRRQEYSHLRPHSALGYILPAPEAQWLGDDGSATLRRHPMTLTL